MTQRRPRPCLVCGTLTRNASRCDIHQAEWQARREQARGTREQRGYDWSWRNASRKVVSQHRAVYGAWCPGWNCDGHPSDDLTGDHIVPISRGGSNASDNIRVLCRPCNSRRKAQRD